jgi:hypothetical protein
LFRLSFVATLAFLTVLSLSCDNGDKRFKPVYPVRGQVFFEGKPAAGASIAFHATEVEEHPWTKPAAQVDEQGNFVVSTYRSDDGMPKGKYDVTIIWLPKGYVGPAEKANKLPTRYADKATSGISIEVKEGDNVLPRIDLTK